MHRMLYLSTLTIRVDVIKKAYRKLALKWHPGILYLFISFADKNIDNIEEATERTQMINRAWEVRYYFN